MSEDEFWWKLYILLNQLEGFSELGACDGIEPKKYRIGPESTIHGGMSFLGGKMMDRKFIYYLRREAKSIADLDWASCLPNSKDSDWIWIESDKVIIEAPTEESN